jgi:hypothetical protein
MTPEQEQAYAIGLENGTATGERNGMVKAYLDMQAVSAARLRSAPQYTDTRVAQEMLDHCNGRLTALMDGTPEGSLKVTVEVTDGTER